MQQIAVKISLVIFRVDSDKLLVYLQNRLLPSENIAETESLDEQVEKIFLKNIGFPLSNNYVEQLYTITNKKNEITIVYYALLANNDKLIVNTQHWIFVSDERIPERDIISYAIQRLQWKIEYTNVVYSLLPRAFTLSNLQKTYEVILEKQLDKRNFRKKILSLKFIKPTGKKRTDNARPAQMYAFTKCSPMIIKVFS